MSCCQESYGGLRDKPPMRPDFYHTNYALAGLSATQYHFIYDPNINPVKGDDQIAFKWKVEGNGEGDEIDHVAKIHPIFVTPWGDAEAMKNWFVEKDSK